MYQSDIIGFQGQFNKNYLTQDELDKHNWNELYPKAEFEIKPTNYLITGKVYNYYDNKLECFTINQLLPEAFKF